MYTYRVEVWTKYVTAGTNQSWCMYNMPTMALFLAANNAEASMP